VAMHLSLDPEEKRMIVSLDTSRMESILWVDKVNQLVCAEAGIVGEDLENQLMKQGYRVGHVPVPITLLIVPGFL
jgi:alkyldihydroxyacetonephosphate synthase